VVKWSPSEYWMLYLSKQSVVAYFVFVSIVCKAIYIYIEHVYCSRSQNNIFCGRVLSMRPLRRAPLWLGLPRSALGSPDLCGSASMLSYAVASGVPPLITPVFFFPQKPVSNPPWTAFDAAAHTLQPPEDRQAPVATRDADLGSG
jgi:hypothetical protein